MEQENTVFRPARPLVIGLLGGIASGKSTVAKFMAKHGLRRIDADETARAVVDRPAVAAALKSRFGAAVFATDGRLDRQRLAAIVFDDARARRDLEQITHPAIREAIENDLAAARAADQSVVLDVPLLLEGGLIEQCDVAVFVTSSPESRAARARGRGWSEGELERREAHQTDLVVKRRRSDHTIDNDGTIAETQRQVTLILQQLQHGA